MDKKELSELVKSGESPTLEFKEALNNSIGKEMCAFANSKGGKILLGIGDSGEIMGTKITNNLKSQVQDYARNIEPPLIVSVEEAGDVLVVEVPEGKDKPYSANGRFYSRQGANTQQLKRDEIRRFFEKEGLLLFDEKVNSKFNLESDFNQNSYDHFLKESGISPGLQKEDVLRNLELFDDGKMKNAGVLLFCNKVTHFFLNATITCALFEGDSKLNILDRKEFEGDLISNFEDAFIYVRSKLNTNYIINDKYRVEKLELPKEAIREAILNAIAHRDYFS
ncbi:putative DNA binding domain-containing protein, partial [archaeon]|nr:putative DNA binding domain-containing protein [archaeon]